MADWQLPPDHEERLAARDFQIKAVEEMGKQARAQRTATTDEEGRPRPDPNLYVSMGPSKSGGPLHPAVEQAIEDNLVEVLKAKFGLDCWDDSVEDTARRVLRYWDEMSQFKGQPAVPGEVQLPFEFTVFKQDGGQMICVPNIEFSSLCAHHLLPFKGTAHVAYISHKLKVGLSKIPRLVDFWAARPQMQERLTEQIAKDLKARLEPHGVMVVIEATHTCMACRGVRKHNGAMITALPTGVYLSNPAARDEFFAYIAPYRTGVR